MSVKGAGRPWIKGWMISDTHGAVSFCIWSYQRKRHISYLIKAILKLLHKLSVAREVLPHMIIPSWQQVLRFGAPVVQQSAQGQKRLLPSTKLQA